MQGDCAYTLLVARNETGDDMFEPLSEPYQSLYEGAAAACLGAFSGKSQLWATATVRLGQIDVASLNCWDREVYKVYDALVRAYEANPNTEFRRGHASGESACPRIIAAVPDHGPRAGGYTVELKGINLPSTLEITFYNEYAPVVFAQRVANDTLEFAMPQAWTDDPFVLFRPSEQPRGWAPPLRFQWDD
jgi:hypothetical protein